MIKKYCTKYEFILSKIIFSLIMFWGIRVFTEYRLLSNLFLVYLAFCVGMHLAYKKHQKYINNVIRPKRYYRDIIESLYWDTDSKYITSTSEDKKIGALLSKKIKEL